MNRYSWDTEERLLYEDVIDIEEFARFQNKFSKATNLFVVCYDGNGRRVTEPSGSEEEKALIREIIEREQMQSILERVAPGTLEDTAVEDLNVPNMKLAAVSIEIQNKKYLTWVVIAILSDYSQEGYVEEAVTGFSATTTEIQFYRALDLLRETSQSILNNRYNAVNANYESRRSKDSQEELSENLKRNEATTEVVQMLDSDEPIEGIMRKVLAIVGTHLEVSSAQVYQFEPGGECMDVIAEWCNKGIVSYFDKTKNIQALHFMRGDKPIVLSSDSRDGFDDKNELDEMNVQAFVSFPLLQNRGRRMYVCFLQNGSKRIWNVEEVKFIADAVKIMQSILTKRIQKNSLASSYASLEAVLDNVACGIYVKDEKTGEILFENRNFKNNFSNEIKEGTIDFLLENGIPLGGRHDMYEIARIASGQWYDMLTTHITWVDGRKATLYSLYEITDKKIYQRKIEQQAYTDFLTGLYNRMCCERDLARHVDEAKKNNVKGGLLYLDLDDFKHINDGLGHQYGDVLLKSISNSLQRIEGIQNTCYRMGGDEFVIVVPPKSFERFDKIVEDIKKIFSRPWFLKDADYYCTMSMGLVNFPDDGDSVQDLIKKADIAMYEAKKSGKNRVASYSENIESASHRRLDLEKNMRDATVGGYHEFQVYYQPLIDIQRDGTPCVGAEALIRWNSAELGFISPSDFIPLAEYLGLINPIGNHVLREACKDCKRWNDNGYPHYKVNVNLSVVQLLQTDIVDIVKRTVEETGINPHNLTLEVTESLAINDMERMKEILGSIKEIGVRIALDDFGTGYSSLNHIREIPFDVIKVDQSFVKDLSEDAYSQSFIKMVAELASTIDVSICVEGIETKEQYKVLEGMKVRLVQGYYFDRPMPRTAFEEKYTKTTN